MLYWKTFKLACFVHSSEIAKSMAIGLDVL
jgi:hypothetical protein